MLRSHTAGVRRFDLQQLKQLQKNVEPRPLRLAPLHMDVHGDNIVVTSAGLRLIDWGIPATAILQIGAVAAVWVEDERQHRQLADAYAARADRRQQLWRRAHDCGTPRVIMLQKQGGSNTAGDKPASNNEFYQSWPMKHGANCV